MRRAAFPTLLLALLLLAGAGCAQPAQEEEPEASGSQAGAETSEGTIPDSALVGGSGRAST